MKIFRARTPNDDGGASSRNNDIESEIERNFKCQETGLYENWTDYDSGKRQGDQFSSVFEWERWDYVHRV